MIRRIRIVPVLAFALGGLAAPVAAQPAPAAPAAGHAAMGHGDGAAMAMAMPLPEGASPATRAYIEAANAMHQGMDIAYTGDADVDFVRGMIAHHKGAVAMARIVLKEGKDPQIRKLAEGVVSAQEAEVTQMNDWLAARGLAAE